jgi:hypothetical protein
MDGIPGTRGIPWMKGTPEMKGIPRKKHEFHEWNTNENGWKVRVLPCG